MSRARQLLVVTVLCLLLTTGEGAAKAAPLPYQEGVHSTVELLRSLERGVAHLPEYQVRIQALTQSFGDVFGSLVRTMRNDAFRASVLSVFVDNPRWSNQLQVKTLQATQIESTEALLRGVVTNVPPSIKKSSAVVVRAFDFNVGERRPLRLLVASSSEAFEVKVTGLSCNTRYSYRALLAYKDGLTKGYNQYFSTAPCE